MLYRNRLKNRDCGEEDPQNWNSERAALTERQGASEDVNFEENLTWPKADSPGCFGIK